MKWRLAVGLISVSILSWASWSALAKQTPPAEINLPTNSLPASIIHPPGAKVEPSVRIEWVGPKSIRVGQANDFTLCVRNTFQHSVENVTVSASGPIVSSEPKAVEKGEVFGGASAKLQQSKKSKFKFEW